MVKATQLLVGLTEREAQHARRALGREPNEVEWAIIDAEWSEHCSYKSSKEILRQLPTKGPRVLVGPGYDAGVLDVGDGYVVSVHIESHNHPSAIDPYGGAATGIGGVLRDILSMGTRPIGLIDILRFGYPDKSRHSRWLFNNVIQGIADYGNCVGVPTVAGEVEFDESFERNCLVDVACVGVGRRKDLVLAEARFPGDILVLTGGSTGRDGIGGATFASKNLSGDADSERSSVQVPAPFTKKLILDAITEAVEGHTIRGMKDLGGGGLSSALSEVAWNGGTGVDVELGRITLREPDMTPAEIMTSESQERMLLIAKPANLQTLLGILNKYGLPSSVIGEVTADGRLTVRAGGEVVARLPAGLVARAPAMPRRSNKPKPALTEQLVKSREGHGLSRILLSLLSSPNLASRRWVYQQYDHEVGARTVVKPGAGDASVLKLPNGKFLAVKGDGNSKVSFLDPYHGAAGCVAEACRNLVAVGAEPIGLVDHLQFGDPADPEVYWSFKEAVHGLADYCSAIKLPVVGGKVSFHNQDMVSGRAVKPSPIALVVGLIEDATHIMTPGFKEEGDVIIAVGRTRAELGGSEYYETLHHNWGIVPRADPASDLRTNGGLLKLVREGLVNAVHDCSKGGLATALAEMCTASRIGARVDLRRIPSEQMPSDMMLFSESHGRFLISANPKVAERVGRVLSGADVEYSAVGRVIGRRLSITTDSSEVVSLSVREMARAWESCLPSIMGDVR
jgi:phosphoribosylformylglycinamidine synthase